MMAVAAVAVAASPPPTRGEIAGGGMPVAQCAIAPGKTLVVSVDFVLKDTGRALAMAATKIRLFFPQITIRGNSHKAA